MAGDMVISPGISWNSSSLAFRAIAVFPRIELKKIAGDLEGKLYGSVDAGLDFMDLTNLSRAEYAVVLGWLRSHYQHSKCAGRLGFLEPEYFAGVMRHFEDLLEIMGADKRLAEF